MSKLFISFLFLFSSSAFAVDLNCATPYSVVEEGVMAFYTMLSGGDLNERQTEVLDAFMVRSEANLAFAAELEKVSDTMQALVDLNYELALDDHVALMAGAFYRTCNK